MLLLLSYPSVEQTLDNFLQARGEGPKYLNSLDNDLCNSISLSFFKISLKNYFVNSY